MFQPRLQTSTKARQVKVASDATVSLLLRGSCTKCGGNQIRVPASEDAASHPRH